MGCGVSSELFRMQSADISASQSFFFFFWLVFGPALAHFIWLTKWSINPSPAKIDAVEAVVATATATVATAIVAISAFGPKALGRTLARACDAHFPIEPRQRRPG